MGPEVEEFIEEPEYFFRFSATLRIFGDIGDLEAITAELGVAPALMCIGGARSLCRPLCGSTSMICGPTPLRFRRIVHCKSIWKHSGAPFGRMSAI